jgi:hypothetical protein
MRQTISQRYDEIKGRRHAEAEATAKAHFGEIPTAFYKPGGEHNDYQPQVCQVIAIAPEYVIGAYFEKRPTMKNLQALLDADPVSIDNIRISMRREVQGGSESWSDFIRDIGRKIYATAEEAAAIGEERRKAYELLPGQFRCAYCGNGAYQESKVRKRIISRQYENFGKEFDHCSAQCALHNQMAHEG